jgi:protein CpxP
MTFASLARPLALSAFLLAGSVAAVSAQTPPANPDPAKPPAAQAATSARPETVEQRISALKTALKITPDQESKWEKVAVAMRENAQKMDKVIQDKRANMANMNALDDLRTYQDISQAHVDGLKNLISSFKSLYDSMPAEQKANADKVFDSYGPSRAGKQG